MVSCLVLLVPSLLFTFTEPSLRICLQSFSRMIQMRMFPHGCHEYHMILTKSTIYGHNDGMLFVLLVPSLLFTFSEPCQLTCLQPFFRMMQMRTMFPHGGCHEYNILTKSRIYMTTMVCPCLVLFLPSQLFTFLSLVNLHVCNPSLG